MALFEWKQSYSVNIKEADNQHKGLIASLNQLYEAMKNNETHEVIAGILKNLSAYVGVHFSYEENLMKRYNYPGYLDHKKEHETFTAKVGEFIEKHRQGHVMVSLEVMNFLKDWLKNHILGSDKKYGPFLNQKGIA